MFEARIAAGRADARRACRKSSFLTASFSTIASTTRSAPARRVEVASSSRCARAPRPSPRPCACPWRPRARGSSRSSRGPSARKRSSTSDEHDGQAGGRRDVRDAAAHLAGADDAERPDLHRADSIARGAANAKQRAGAGARRSAVDGRRDCDSAAFRSATANATPTATIDATLQTSAPTNGSSDTPPSTTNPAASAAGRRAGATLFRSFWPRSRKSAAIPKIFATTATRAEGERDRNRERRRAAARAPRPRRERASARRARRPAASPTSPPRRTSRPARAASAKK